MLREYVGDSAFFAALQRYLQENRYKNAEAHTLRLAFEAVTGQDLNWFWNQWVFGAGHPRLDVRSQYDPGVHRVSVTVRQLQDSDHVFRLPVKIDVYSPSGKVRYPVWLSKPTDTFSFPCPDQPQLVNVDADKMLLCEKTDHKSTAEYVYQYQHAGNYMDRLEAIQYCLGKQEEPEALEFLKTALKTPTPV
jgi:aminopeptidase N